MCCLNIGISWEKKFQATPIMDLLGPATPFYLYGSVPAPDEDPLHFTPLTKSWSKACTFPQIVLSRRIYLHSIHAEIKRFCQQINNRLIIRGLNGSFNPLSTSCRLFSFPSSLFYPFFFLPLSPRSIHE